ncbi:hypothetical protein GSS88_00010 [Corynebacterium sp. 3HC-13]|uniref:hypothetical protein n=1 Tax=Corynebacterium poyangense TaxID=2684405 RepID=UPI001CCE27A2|nr:hypothetical protein [Corynebacterium poyangense]MBZ8176193.1 hypothetical protein [Corynebacterium poyangense]
MGNRIRRTLAIAISSSLILASPLASAQDILNPPGMGDRTDYYFDVSPTMQDSIIQGGTTAAGGLVGLLGGGVTGVIGSTIAATATPAIQNAACSKEGKVARVYYTLDGNVTLVECI